MTKNLDKENTNNSFKVEYEYNNTYDILVIQVKKPYEHGRTVEMREGVLLDFDSDNIPVALEILDASKVLNVPEYSLNEILHFNMKVFVDNKSISIVANFGVMINNKKQSSIFESFTSNYSHIPNMEAELIVA